MVAEVGAPAWWGVGGGRRAQKLWVDKIKKMLDEEIYTLLFYLSGILL